MQEFTVDFDIFSLQYQDIAHQSIRFRKLAGIHWYDKKRTLELKLDVLRCRLPRSP